MTEGTSDKGVYFKRFLNVLFVLCILWAAFVLVMGLAGLGHGSGFDWEGWFFGGVLTCVASLASVAAVNYISFGKIKLWHSLSRAS